MKQLLLIGTYSFGHVQQKAPLLINYIFLLFNKYMISIKCISHPNEEEYLQSIDEKTNFQKLFVNSKHQFQIKQQIAFQQCFIVPDCDYNHSFQPQQNVLNAVNKLKQLDKNYGGQIRFVFPVDNNILVKMVYEKRVQFFFDASLAAKLQQFIMEKLQYISDKTPNLSIFNITLNGKIYVPNETERIRDLHTKTKARSITIIANKKQQKQSQVKGIKKILNDENQKEAYRMQSKKNEENKIDKKQEKKTIPQINRQSYKKGGNLLNQEREDKQKNAFQKKKDQFITLIINFQVQDNKYSQLSYEVSQNNSLQQVIDGILQKMSVAGFDWDLNSASLRPENDLKIYFGKAQFLKRHRPFKQLDFKKGETYNFKFIRQYQGG